MRTSEKPPLHFIGVCGKAMGGIAAALARAGWKITGSDEACYSPMKDFLESASLQVLTPYRAENIPADAELMIVGKRVAETNPELQWMLQQRLTHQSFPQFLRDRFLSRSRNAVVTGGVGKTTTTAMLAWILEANGLQPDYLIGGIAENFEMPARFSGAKFTVLEGDEYASCFDDPTPKFLHYQPEIVVITNIIEDHPDLYPRFEDLAAVFARLVESVPQNGCLILPDDDATAGKIAETARCRVITTGTGLSATHPITQIRLLPNYSSFRLREVDFEISVCGLMNIRNAAMAVLAATRWGVSPEKSAEALRLFRGVRNRQEEKQVGSCQLVYDKASHPFALTELIRAMRQRFPGRRLVSIIQPRATGGKDWVYQRDLPKALAGFDEVILAGPYEHRPQQKSSWASDPFCLDSLATALMENGSEVQVQRDFFQQPERVLQQLQAKDVVVVSMSEQSVSVRGRLEEVLQEIVNRSAREEVFAGLGAKEGGGVGV